MIFHVKNRLYEEKVAQMPQKFQEGELKNGSTNLYCQWYDPFVGLMIWEAKDEKDLQSKIKPFKPYAEFLEITRVVTSEESQRLMFEKLKNI